MQAAGKLSAFNDFKSLRCIARHVIRLAECRKNLIFQDLI